MTEDGTMAGAIDLSEKNRVFVRQVHELGEWLGFETRNKYRIVDERGLEVGYAAEQQKGVFGFLLRQYLGHWRRFDIHFFAPDGSLAWIGRHPFRFFFQRLELYDRDGLFRGAVQRRFGILTKKFDVVDHREITILEVSSPVWRPWTFRFVRRGKEAARVAKKWSGLLSEAFTDRDNFLVEFGDPTLTAEERSLVLAAAIFVDLLYFENHRN